MDQRIIKDAQVIKKQLNALGQVDIDEAAIRELLASFKSHYTLNDVMKLFVQSNEGNADEDVTVYEIAKAGPSNASQKSQNTSGNKKPDTEGAAAACKKICINIDSSSEDSADSYVDDYDDSYESSPSWQSDSFSYTSTPMRRDDVCMNVDIEMIEENNNDPNNNQDSLQVWHEKSDSPIHDVLLHDSYEIDSIEDAQPGCSKNHSNADSASVLTKIQEEALKICDLLPKIQYMWAYQMLYKNRYAYNRVELSLWDLLPNKRPMPENPSKRKFIEDRRTVNNKKPVMRVQNTKTEPNDGSENARRTETIWTERSIQCEAQSEPNVCSHAHKKNVERSSLNDCSKGLVVASEQKFISIPGKNTLLRPSQLTINNKRPLNRVSVASKTFTLKPPKLTPVPEQTEDQANGESPSNAKLQKKNPVWFVPCSTSAVFNNERQSHSVQQLAQPLGFPLNSKDIPIHAAPGESLSPSNGVPVQAPSTSAAATPDASVHAASASAAATPDASVHAASTSAATTSDACVHPPSTSAATDAFVRPPSTSAATDAFVRPPSTSAAATDAFVNASSTSAAATEASVNAPSTSAAATSNASVNAPSTSAAATFNAPVNAPLTSAAATSDASVNAPLTSAAATDASVHVQLRNAAEGFDYDMPRPIIIKRYPLPEATDAFVNAPSASAAATDASVRVELRNAAESFDYDMPRPIIIKRYPLPEATDAFVNAPSASAAATDASVRVELRNVAEGFDYDMLHPIIIKRHPRPAATDAFDNVPSTSALVTDASVHVRWRNEVDGLDYEIPHHIIIKTETRPEVLSQDAGNTREEPLSPELNTTYNTLVAMFPHVDRAFIKENCRLHYAREKYALPAERLQDLTDLLLLYANDNEQKTANVQDGHKDQQMYDMDTQFEYLSEIFPDADPMYLRENVRKTCNNPAAMTEFIQSTLERRDYPTKNQKLTEMKITKQQKQLTTHFNLMEFLNVFPDPIAYFEDPNRECRSSVDGLEFLKFHFRSFKMSTIAQVYEEHKYNLSLTARALRRMPPDMKTRRYMNLIPPKRIPLLQECAFVRNFYEIQDYLQRLKEKENQNFEILKTRNELLECQCCFDSECLPTKCSSCNDGHVFCNSCIIKGAEVCLSQAQTRVPCFAECNEEFSLSVLQRILPPTKFSALLHKCQEGEVMAAGIEGLVSCPFCHFASIPPPEDKVFKCYNPECMKESCRQCRELNHVPLRCNEVETKQTEKARLFLEEKMTEALVRKCHSCQRTYMKESGCNRIVCVCGAVMCYLCDKPIQGYGHFNAQGAANSHLCPLFSDDAYVNAQGVRRVAEETIRHIRMENPDVQLNTERLMPVLPMARPGPHRDIENANQLPERIRRITSFAP